MNDAGMRLPATSPGVEPGDGTRVDSKGARPSTFGDRDGCPGGSGGRMASAAAFASILVSAISSNILPAALKRAAPDIGVSPEQLALAASVQFAGFFVATLVGGAVSDRLGKKKVLLFACILIALGAGAWILTGSMLQACFAAALLGMGGGILESMASALLTDLFPHRRALVLNLSQMAFCAGAIAGPAIMAILLPMGVSWRIFFAAEAALGVILMGFYGLATIRRPPGHAQVDGGAILRVLRDRGVILLSFCLFCYVLAESGVAFYVNLYLQERHDAPERWAILGISLVWGAMLIGRMLCAALGERWQAGRLVAMLCVVTAGSLMLQAVATGWVVSFVLFGLAGLLMSGIWPMVVALGASIHPGRTGTVLGIVIASGALGVVAAPAVVSCLLQAGVSAYVFPVFAMVMLAAAAAVWAMRLSPCPHSK